MRNMPGCDVSPAAPACFNPGTIRLDRLPIAMSAAQAVNRPIHLTARIASRWPSAAGTEIFAIAVVLSLCQVLKAARKWPYSVPTEAGAGQLMTIEASLSHDLNKVATPDGILCVGAGKTAYIGRLEQVDWHQHGAPVFIAGLAGSFRLGTPDGSWLRCSAAIIPAGLRHPLDVGAHPSP